MKRYKWILFALLAGSMAFQLLIGIWMLVDVDSAAQVLLGIKGDSAPLESWEFIMLVKMAGKAFLMLAGYGGLTLFFLLRDDSSAYLLSLSTGIMILLISFSTFAQYGSFIVLATDSLRGLLIVIAAHLYQRNYLSESPLEVLE